jgi:hypothetical protein
LLCNGGDPLVIRSLMVPVVVASIDTVSCTFMVAGVSAAVGSPAVAGILSVAGVNIFLRPLKVHKIEIFFGFDFEICNISLIIRSTY